MSAYIPQAQLDSLVRAVAPGRVVVLYGPRRVGKTTLIRQFATEHAPDALVVSGEDITVRHYLESQSVERLRSFVGARRTLIVDEAQHVREIGLSLKLLVDHVDGLRVIATGSSSFDLAQRTGEPLTGRKRTLLLLPLSQLELSPRETAHETAAGLESRLVYGAYPEVVLEASASEREAYLRELISSYLFRDVLALEGVRQAAKLLRLLQSLAFQVGQEVSLPELGSRVGLAVRTVDRYLDLLEKAFVLYSRHGFSRNLRKEITRSRRYFFFDNGVRNGLIANFSPLALRDDVGALWENYVLGERLKFNLYTGRFVESYFWRTYDQQEVDLVESHGGRLAAAEMKWSPRASVRPPAGWRRAYPEATWQVVHPDNYLDFIASPGSASERDSQHERGASPVGAPG